MKIYSKTKWLQRSPSVLKAIVMKDLGSDDEDEKSESDKSDSESDSESKSDSEESEEGGSSSTLAVFDPKSSHSSWSYDKKSKFMKCNNGSWYTAISTKSIDKFTIELGSGVGSYMVGFILKSSYNQNAANYNTGHYWYASSSGLYGQGNRITFNASGGCNSGTKIGCIFNRKKLVITYCKEGSSVGDGWQLNDKKAKFFAVVDSCTNGSQFKFIKGKYPKK